MTAFDKWYNGMVGFHINSERILDDLNTLHGYCQDTVNPETVRKWMTVCWNAAIEAAQKELGTEAYYWMDGRDDYGPSYPEQQIEKLKIS
jgi:hypothetical protein